LFVGQKKDGSDVIRILEAYKKVWSKEIKIFQLQKRVVGIEIAVGAFFNGNEFIYPININFEHKKLFRAISVPRQVRWAPACSGAPEQSVLPDT